MAQVGGDKETGDTWGRRSRGSGGTGIRRQVAQGGGNEGQVNPIRHKGLKEKKK